MICEGFLNNGTIVILPACRSNQLCAESDSENLGGKRLASVQLFLLSSLSLHGLTADVDVELNID